MEPTKGKGEDGTHGCGEGGRSLRGARAWTEPTDGAGRLTEPTDGEVVDGTHRWGLRADGAYGRVGTAIDGAHRQE